MKPQIESNKMIHILPGEIVQVFGVLPAECTLVLPEIRKPSIALIDADYLLEADFLSATATVASLLQTWLADVPVASFEELVDDLGLEESLHLPVRLASTDLRFRLATLEAILAGAQVIQIVSPGQMDDATDFLRNAQAFADDLAEAHLRTTPTFVIYDGDDVPGITLIADLILTLEGGKMRELDVVI